MAYDSINKKLYATASDGISLAQISRCLEDYRLDSNGNINLEMMCTSDNINEWSRKKPVRSSKLGVLTDADMASANFGFNIGGMDGDNNATAVYEADPNVALSKAIASGGKWTYNKPRGGTTEWYRLLDFDGYNHKAAPPYVTTLEPENTNESTITTNKSTIWADIEQSEKCEIPVQDLAGTIFGDDLSDYYPALLWRKRGETNGVQIAVHYATIGESLGGGDRVTFNPTFTSAGTYDMVFAITNADPSEPYEDDKVWLYLPNTYRQVTYNPMSGVVDITLNWNNNNGFVVNYSGNIVTSVALRFYTRLIDLTYFPEAYIYGELLNADGEPLAENYIFTGEIDEESGPISRVLTLTNPQTDALYANELYVRVYYRYREFDSNDAFTTRHIDLVSNTSTADYVAPVAISSLRTSEYAVDLNGQWQLSSAVANPDSATYDGVYESFSNFNTNSKGAIMYITIKGYEAFKLYIRSDAETNYDYVMVSQLDQTITNDTSYSSSAVKAHTRGNQQSGTAISNYTLVEFTAIDGEEHTITIVYRKDGSTHSGTDKGYILIPKNQ